MAEPGLAELVRDADLVECAGHAAGVGHVHDPVAGAVIEEHGRVVRAHMLDRGREAVEVGELVR